MSKFTPGPWHYDRNISVIHGTPRYGSLEQTKAGGEFQGAECNALYEVCTVRRVRVYEFTMSGGEHYPVKPEIEKHFGDQMQANANLIAAAPDLFAALEGIVDFCDDPDPIATVSLALGLAKLLIPARSALLKAQGEPQ